MRLTVTLNSALSPTQPIEVIQGSSKAIDLYLRDENDIPIDLTSLTEFKAEVHAATGIPIEITMTAMEVVVVGNALLGHVQLQFTGTKTALFGLTNFDAIDNPVYTDLQIKATITSNPDYAPYIKRLSGVLNVLPALS